MKKILVLENESFIKEKSSFNNWIEKMMDQGHEVKILLRLKHVERMELIKSVEWCDTIAVETTFIDMDQVNEMAVLLSNFPKPIDILIHNYQVEQKLNELDDKTLYSVKQHRFYSLEIYGDGNSHERVSFEKRNNEYAKKDQKEKDFILSRKDAKTGRKVKIKKLMGFNDAFKGLKSGMVVDEIDNSKNDPNPSRGIWVWGNGEPVKLLNEGQYKEFEFVDAISNDELVIEIIKSVGAKPTKRNAMAIKGALLDEDYETSTSKANLICEMLNIPKRHNRSTIGGMIANNMSLLKEEVA